MCKCFYKNVKARILQTYLSRRMHLISWNITYKPNLTAVGTIMIIFIKKHFSNFVQFERSISRVIWYIRVIKNYPSYVRLHQIWSLVNLIFNKIKLKRYNHQKSTLLRSINRSSRSEVFCKKSALRNFAKFTGKHLCQSLFFNKIAGLRQNTSGGCFCINFFRQLPHIINR